MNAGQTMTPRVSVVVPSYRAGRYLAELCASLVRQTCADFEVLVLADGGDDDRHPEVAPYAQDPRFRLQAWTPNRGVAKATAQLLRQVRAPYWCYPGADDLLEPEFLARRLEAAEAAPEAVAIFGPGRQIDEHGEDVWYHPARVLAQRFAALAGTTIAPERMLRLLLQDNVVNTPSIFCRSAPTVPLLVGAEVGWSYAQDYHYWILLAAAGGFYYDARELHAYRMHAQQLSRDPAKEAARLAEFRLVPLVALSEAARVSAAGAACWREWRGPLYDRWLLRAAALARRGRLQSAWSERAAQAFHGRRCGPVRRAADFFLRLPRALALHRAEQRRAARQIWANGLRAVDDPVFRNENAS